MRLIILTISLFIVNCIISQKNSVFPKKTFKIDTLIYLKDTTNLFVRELWDTTVVKTYYCSADSNDRAFRYGFLYLKKGKYREYGLKNIRDVTFYDRPKEYEGIRCGDTYPFTILRLK